jgi:hypothetical protein
MTGPYVFVVPLMPVSRAFFVVAAVAAVLAWPANGSAALSCGLPEAQPTWIDFADGSVSFWQERFARPGIVVATGGPGLASEARAAGAATVHWDMYLRKRVGTPSEPADPATIEKRADALFDYAVSVSGCQTPLIALNELWGASLPTPLTLTAERYRANVLRFVTRLKERGGRPALLVSSDPFTGGDAAAWWKSVAEVSDLVLENYANANLIWRDGPVDGSRRLRVRHRQAVAKLLAIGIPSSRIGIMIGFQTGAGTGGREGLRPRSRWFSVAKWHALAVREVARELDVAHVWSWGWAQRDARSNDRDKTYAACVWLWARDAGLCDAPAILGDELDADRKTGQLDLPAGARCMYGTTPLTASAVAALAKVTGDRELALTALVARASARERARVSPDATLAMERRVIATRFGGSGAAFRTALAESGASLLVARGILADELRWHEIASRLSVGRISTRDIGRFRATFAPVLAREVSVSPAPSWLPEGRGVALATSAPATVFALGTGRRATIRTVEGTFVVETHDDTTALAAVPADRARAAVVRELRAERRADAYSLWTIRAQRSAESKLVCERDRLPELGVVTLSTYAPFLSLHEAEAARWASSRRG